MKPIIFLMGPTASGKTPLAVELVQRLPCEIISVDSAMVFKEMNIGTAKPTADILKIAPHRLIDFLDPSEHYSAGQFKRDALQEIENIHEQGKIPLLVGGTMMYFKTLQQGIAPLPSRDENLRSALLEQGEREGWENLHRKLTAIDPEAAKRIHPNDSQRIQRALEVFMLTGKTISEFQATETEPLSQYRIIGLGIAPKERKILHERIAVRFEQMLKEGFIEEVEKLYKRGDLTPQLPSIRSVGYRQIWDYLAGNSNQEEMQAKALAATRQLAKRQLTWLRAWPNLEWFISDDANLAEKVTLYLQQAVAHQAC